MRSRIVLILMTLAVLVLPWAGVQLVQQMERLLREGQQQAQMHAAQAIAQAFAQLSAERWPDGASAPLHRLELPVQLDGYADEWQALTLERNGDATLNAWLSESPLGLDLLIEVQDRSKLRADASAGVPRADHLQLRLRSGDGEREIRIANAAPGSAQMLESEPAADVLPLQGHWQETTEGYRVELRVPEWQAPLSIALRALDFGAAAGQAPTSLVWMNAPEGVVIQAPDPAWRNTLQSLLPPRTRARLLDRNGWVMAQAGNLLPRNASESVASSSAKESNRFYAWLYRLLVSPPLTDAARFDADRLRIDADFVREAQAGKPAGALRAANSRETVIAMSAMPLGDATHPRGVLLLEQPSDALLLLTNRAVFGVLTASLLAVLLGAAILLSFASIQSMRIRKLRNAAERAMTPDARFSNPIPHLEARDELGDLARSFSRLLGEISAYTDYLRTLASKLSHELHTPLAIVKSSLENLEHESLPAHARTYAQRARDGAERLGNLIRAMSEASRMERSILSAEGEDFDLCEVVRGCAESYRALLGQRRFDVDIPDHPLPFFGAPELIAQALDKLIDNARSFTPDSGWIRLVLVPLERGVFLSVLNQGPLLPEKMHGRVFDSLVSVRDKGGPAGSTDAPHLGLGLFIVRLIAELHEGRASAHNLANGDGVEVRLELLGMPREKSA